MMRRVDAGQYSQSLRVHLILCMIELDNVMDGERVEINNVLKLNLF